MEQPGKAVDIGLVLQGGGALGAYECGAVAALLELIQQYQADGRNVHLRAVTGVSIGAINAACVAGASDEANAIDRLNALWDDFTIRASALWLPFEPRDLSVFGLPSFYTPRSDYWSALSWTHFYDTAPLRETLKLHACFDTINSADPRIIFAVSAVDVVSGKLTTFANHALGDVARVTIDAAHVMASGSLPPAFPWTDVKGSHYWDGGLVDNTPLGVAIDALASSDADRMLVVMNLFPQRARLPANMTGVQDRVQELRYGNRLRQDAGFARRINALVETIDEMVKVTGYDGLEPWLQARVDEARRYTVLDAIVNIDMQDPDGDREPREQEAFDGEYGFRDFSLATIKARRARGYDVAMKKLVPAFENRWHEPPETEPMAARS
jgi:NTE family protein